MPDTLGVVLAAGEATRMPNKVLLPRDAHGGLVMDSAVMLCMRAFSAGMHVRIVVAPDGVVEAVSRMRGTVPKYISFVVQHEARGVPDAIATAVDGVDCDQVLVTFADNVYGERERDNVDHALVGPKGNYAAQRWVERGHGQLDGWYGSWKRRAEMNPSNKMRLAGWYLLTCEAAVSGKRGEDSISFLNRINASPCLCHGPWWDVGTPESYKEFIDAVR